MRVDDVRALTIFDGLTDDQLAELVNLGAEVAIVPGVDLFREGEPAEFWWLLVAGAIDLLRRVGREETVVASMNVPGRWAGGFRAWDEHGTYLATGRGVTSGRVLRVPSVALRDLSNAWFPFSGHLIEGLYRTARSMSPQRGNESRSWRSARWRPAWLTRSPTTRRRRPRGPSTPSNRRVSRWFPRSVSWLA